MSLRADRRAAVEIEEVQAAQVDRRVRSARPAGRVADCVEPRDDESRARRRRPASDLREVGGLFHVDEPLEHVLDENRDLASSSTCTSCSGPSASTARTMPRRRPRPSPSPPAGLRRAPPGRMPTAIGFPTWLASSERACSASRGSGSVDDPRRQHESVAMRARASPSSMFIGGTADEAGHEEVGRPFVHGSVGRRPVGCPLCR